MFAWLMNPWMLGLGGLAVLSPILIHLLNKRRFKIVNWAAMDFLFEAEKKNRRRALFWSMLSGLDEEVRELPHGYGTEIEYNQSKILSQDVEAIAQIVTALSLNPKILLIDLLSCSYGQHFVDSLRKILKRCEFDKIVMIGGSGPVFNRLTNNTIYLQETSKEVLQ
mgnify:CR=1 FL=1